jgi:hypothetical protein
MSANPMDDFCPRCGTMFGFDITIEAPRRKVLCLGCGLALAEPPRALPPSEADDDQLAYDLSEWPPEDRAIATTQLVELGVPYRWEDYLVLVVPAAVEAEFDALLDEIEENAAGEEPVADADPSEDDVGEDDGGEAAAGAMGDLFVAADRLQHGVYDAGKVLGFLEAADAVITSLPPYGIEQAVWERFQDDASDLVAVLDTSTEGDDDPDVIEAARALRDSLRPYI